MSSRGMPRLRPAPSGWEDLKTDTVKGGQRYRVSTIWLLGIDHGHGRKPLYYETMVLSTGADEPNAPDARVQLGAPMFPVPVRDDLYEARYTTAEQARAGHEAAVAEWSDPSC